MCERGRLGGPYSQEQARRYARVALIPGELLEPDLPCLEDTARALARAGELRQAAAAPTRDPTSTKHLCRQPRGLLADAATLKPADHEVVDAA